MLKIFSISEHLHCYEKWRVFVLFSAVSFLHDILFCVLSSLGMRSHFLLSVVGLIALTPKVHCAPLGRSYYFCSASKNPNLYVWEYVVIWL